MATPGTFLAAAQPSPTELVLPGTAELLYGAIAFVVIGTFLIGGTVLAFRAVARRSLSAAPRPPCSAGVGCPCDCHLADPAA